MPGDCSIPVCGGCAIGGVTASPGTALEHSQVGYKLPDLSEVRISPPFLSC